MMPRLLTPAHINGIVTLLVVLCVGATSVDAKFNYTKCPEWYELQTPFVRQNFSLEMFEGTYYELALHDYTQVPICPKPTCIRSHKQVDLQRRLINDSFTLDCYGGAYTIPLLFNLTDQPGVFRGHAKISGKVVYPDTVVDAVLDESGKFYDRVLEFQCIEELDHVVFVGINWYSRQQHATKEYVESFLQMARDRGLDVYMDDGLKVYEPDQSNCTHVA